MAEPAYRIDVEEDEVIVRLRRDALPREQMSRFLDFLELEAIRGRSGLTTEDAAVLADEVDQAVWERARAHVSG